MLIRIGYDIQFDLPERVPMVAMLHVHPSRAGDLREPDTLHTEPVIPIELYMDSFGNVCSRFVAPAGMVRLYNNTLIEDSGNPDQADTAAVQVPLEQLPPETLQYLLPSRYCEVDRLSSTAFELFANTAPGWARIQAICDWVNQKVMFGYQFARPTKTALEVYTERTGVCRDFQHLAITFSRAMGIPARYLTGYLGDIGVPPSMAPGDFSAWFQVYLGARWWSFDARYNVPRIGRVLIATGRDAADVAITTAFGSAPLRSFAVITSEAP